MKYEVPIWEKPTYFGKLRITQQKKTDVRRFYNYLYEERALSISTIDNIHTVLHQVLDLAVEDSYLRNNPSDNALKELKQERNIGASKKKALTLDEQNLFLGFLKDSKEYSHWYPIFALMTGTGLRVGEATGLRWEDIDFEAGTIDVNHTLIYYKHAENGCCFAVHTPKTRAGNRVVPMIDSVREALLQEKEYQEAKGIVSKAVVDGYQDFVFINRFGNVQHQGTLNKALRRIMRDCNKEVLENRKGNEEVVLLPRFSCHTLRHTFTTRLIEANVNIKVVQEALGHSDVSTTLDIYADVTKDMRDKEFKAFEDFMKNRDEM